MNYSIFLVNFSILKFFENIIKKTIYALKCVLYIVVYSLMIFG